VATTNPGGVAKWGDGYADALKGRRAVILPDNDEPGQRHAEAVLASLRRAGVAAAVLALDGLPPKGDVSDWLAAGGTVGDLLHRAEAALRDGGTDAPTLCPTPFALRDPATIPPRRWLYDRHMIGGFVSLTVSPGGLGKSSMVLVEALAMVTGRALLGAAPPRPLRVWCWNGEDPRDEIERRVAAACLHYGITAADMGDRLHTDSGRDVPITLATMGKAGVLIARPAVEAMVAAVTAGGIDVVVIDPFVTSHAVPENDNGAVNAVVALWREIADRTGCAVELVHHAQKAAINAGSEIGMAQSRGASALIDGVRSARYLVAMTEDEAGRAGVETHRGFFRVEMGKANLAPLPDRATWRRVVSVDLFNGTDAYPGGDRVGVVVPWEWPDAFDGVRVEDLKAVKARLASGDWKANDQADAWAGHVVADVLGIDAGPVKKAERTPAQNAARAKVRAMLKAWLRGGELREVLRNDPRTRRETPFIEPAGGDHE
jgi:RecA-family ATPase